MARRDTRLDAYARVPRWLLESSVGSTAVRLFGIIASKYANRSTNTCYPSRRALAGDLHVSDRTIDKALAELRRVGALLIEHRKDPSGDMTTSMYTVVYDQPEDQITEPQSAVHEGQFGQK